MRSVATEKGVQFLDVRDALNGHEVCNSSLDAWSTARTVSAITNEWVRWVNSGCCQGDAQESLHPNAWGEKAIGSCVTLVVRADERQLDLPQHTGCGFQRDDAGHHPVIGCWVIDSGSARP